jgi:uncharacterized HAD superfamily protein
MKRMARIAVDIDGVIASKLESGKYPEDYVKKTPIYKAVESLKEFKEWGHSVFLFTARYEEDREVTENWLNVHGFSGLYEELIMNKPKYDVLIDDRALRFIGSWERARNDIYYLQKSGSWY